MGNANQEVWRRSPYVAFVDDKERVVLLNTGDPHSNRPQLLVGSAASVWRLVCRGLTATQIADTIVEDFELEHSSASADVLVFLHQLEASGLIFRHL